MKKFIKDLGEKDVIHAPTKGIAEKLCNKFNELGLRWYGGGKYSKGDKYPIHGDKTCYNPYVGRIGSRPYFRKEGYTIYTIYDLLDFEDSKFKRGERVLVKYNEMDDWEERTFVAEIKGAIAPYLCVLPDHEDKFNEGEQFYTQSWKYIKKKPAEVTRKQIAEALGVSDFKIVD